MFSASSEARDRNAPTNANQIRLQTSGIRQEHHPIRYQLPARLSFRQGQVKWWAPEGYEAFVHVLDSRSGGRWRVTMPPADGSEVATGGVYRCVEPPRRLSMSAFPR